jgi:hypothetical protein
MDEKKRDREAYRLAFNYLLKHGKSEGVTRAIITKYLHFSKEHEKPKDIPGIYYRMLISARNAGMKPNVIKDVGRLKKILFHFNPSKVLSKYDKSSQVLRDIEEQLVGVRIRKGKRAIFPQYCQTILSAATFLSNYRSAEDFYRWVDLLYADERTRVSLPIIIDREVRGFGFALACDFFKELGYVEFGKPDVHIKRIFRGLELCEQKADDYQVHQAIVRIAHNVRKAPYAVDKLFWLIGSGKFYDDPQIGKKGNIGSLKEAFIKDARPSIGKRTVCVDKM